MPGPALRKPPSILPPMMRAEPASGLPPRLEGVAVPISEMLPALTKEPPDEVGQMKPDGAPSVAGAGMDAAQGLHAGHAGAHAGQGRGDIEIAVQRAVQVDHDGVGGRGIDAGVLNDAAAAQKDIAGDLGALHQLEGSGGIALNDDGRRRGGRGGAGQGVKRGQGGEGDRTVKGVAALEDDADLAGPIGTHD